MPKIKLDFTISEPEEVVMPFGKHRDERLGDIPNKYLYWAIGEFDPDDRAELIAAMSKVLAEREKYGEYVEDEFEAENGKRDPNGYY